MSVIGKPTNSEKQGKGEAHAALVEVVAFLIERRRKRLHSQSEESSNKIEVTECQLSYGSEVSR